MSRTHSPKPGAKTLIPRFPFSNLSPTAFLQAFLNGMMRICARHGLGQRDQIIQQLGLDAGEQFEAAYRYERRLHKPLTHDQYADVILSIKNHIGGNFSRSSAVPGCVRVVNTRCPFGERVKDFPELCHMTSSVFGGIAARNFGYAKVELRKRIATKDGMCDVLIYTDADLAADKPGIDYHRDAVPPMRPLAEDTYRRIQERMDAVWVADTTLQGRSKRDYKPALVAQSPVMQKVLFDVERVAPTKATVLVTGETGVGKEVIARAIHAMSDRWNKKFVPVHCGAIPDTLIESTLFGHEKGAFTGAYEVHHGLFQRAEGGTLFLDEINTLLPATQIKLLRVLQEGEYERVGGDQALYADVRIIAASNCHLEQAVARNEFRRDLFYRLNVVRMDIPPLRQRPEDIPVLVEHILAKLHAKHKKPIASITESVMSEMQRYSWPGNVRELENVLERSFVLATSSTIDYVETAPPLLKEDDRCTVSDPHVWKTVRQEALADTERQYLEDALRRFQGDVKAVAKSMELSPRAVYLKLRNHGLNPGRFR